jgi:hypothetical protein
MLVSSALAGLPPRWRDKFERVVRNQLALCASLITNAVLQGILGNAQRVIRVGIGVPTVPRAEA